MSTEPFIAVIHPDYSKEFCEALFKPEKPQVGTVLFRGEIGWVEPAYRFVRTPPMAFTLAPPKPAPSPQPLPFLRTLLAGRIRRIFEGPPP